MPTRPARSPQRAEALTRECIIGAAVDILDSEGEAALTFRALTTRLATGAGAIYWHVPNKEALLAEASAAIVRAALDRSDIGGLAPLDGIRAIAEAVFDMIDEHPWVGTQLARESRRSSGLMILERLGRRLTGLPLTASARFDIATALFSNVLGVAGQRAAAARVIANGDDRATFLRAVAEEWSGLDPDEFSFVREMAAVLPGHDDRAQFVAGVDLILAGIRASTADVGPSPEETRQI